MKDIPVIPVDEKIHKETTYVANNDSDFKLLEVAPPKEGDGMSVSIEMLRDTLHLYEEEQTLFGLGEPKNTSPKCAFEIWYSGQQTRLIFAIPNKNTERQYRQQLSGYYDGCEIQERTDVEGKFIQTNSDKKEAISVSKMKLEKHYFMPIASPNAKQNELDTDPYKKIINQIDTKDDSRFMIQVLYEPAPEDWTENQTMNIEKYASDVENSTEEKKRLFGLIKDEIETVGLHEDAATEIRSSINEPGFFVEIRVAAICSGETMEEAKNYTKINSKTLINILHNTYNTKLGQALTPVDYGSHSESLIKSELVNMIHRGEEDLGYRTLRSRLSSFIKSLLYSETDKIIMTADELAGLVHLPDNGSITSSSIEWKDRPVSGSVPPSADEFTPVKKQEREKLIQEGRVPDIDDDSQVLETEQTDEETDNKDNDTDSEEEPPSVLFE